MSLDGWLEIRNTCEEFRIVKKPRIDTNKCPPTESVLRKKPQTIENHRTITTPQVLKPPQKYNHRLQNSTLSYATLSEISMGSRALHNWSSIANCSIPQMLACAQSIPRSPFVAIGGNSASTSLHIIDTSAGESQLYRASIDLPLAWPINSMSIASDQKLLCSSHRSIIEVDLTKDLYTTSEIALNLFESISTTSTRRNANLKECGFEDGLLAIGTDSGSLHIWDKREKAVGKSWSHTHGVLSGPRANRIDPPVAHISWCSDTILASACTRSDSVKFWDLRARKPLMTTQENVASISNTRQQNSVGIHGIITQFGKGNVWALTSKGDLISLNPEQSMPDYRLRMTNSKHYDRCITFIENAYWPLIARGGKGGISLVTEPSLHSRESNIDCLRAMQISAPQEANLIGNAVETSCLVWQPFTETLISLDTIGGWQSWSQKGTNNNNRARPIKIKQLPIYVK